MAETISSTLCRRCSASLPDGAVFCHLCGTKQEKPARRPRTRPNGAGTVYKRGKTWTAQLRVKMKEDGKTKLKPFTKGGFATRSEALAYTAKLGPQKQQGARTLEHYWTLYKDNKMKKLSASKQTAYTIAWNKLEPLHYQVAAQIGIKRLQDTVKAKAPTFYPARDMKNLLSHLYKLAMTDGEVLANPAALIELPAHEEKEGEAFTEAEQAAVWERYGQGDVFCGYVLLMMYSGMMPGELLACRKEHIQWDARRIVGSGLKTTYRQETPIVIAEYLVPVLEVLCAYSTGPKVLTMNKDNFYKEYYAALERCKCRRLAPYSCRHTTGTRLDVQQGAAPSVIAKALRQKTVKVQQRYKHPDLQDVQQAFNGLHATGAEKPAV